MIVSSRSSLIYIQEDWVERSSVQFQTAPLIVVTDGSFRLQFEHVEMAAVAFSTSETKIWRLRFGVVYINMTFFKKGVSTTFYLTR